MALSGQRLEIEDFSGGLTSDFSVNAANKAEILDNVIPTHDKKLLQRWGSEIYDDTSTQPANATPVSKLFSFEESLFAIANQYLYYFSTAWTGITGPTSNPGAGIAFNDSVFSLSEWNSHMFFVSDELAKPSKLYKDEDGAFQVRTAGLPAIPATESTPRPTFDAELVTLVNLIKTRLVQHLNNNNGFGTILLFHTATDSSALSKIGDDCTDFDTAVVLLNELAEAYRIHNNDYIGGVYTLHFLERDGQVNFVPFTLVSSATAETRKEARDIAHDLYTKLHNHAGNLDIHDGTGGNTNTPPFVASSSDLLEEFTSGPRILQNISPVFDLANAIRKSYISHQEDATLAHTSTSTSATYTVTASPCFDQSSLVTLLLDLRLSYTNHLEDHLNFSTGLNTAQFAAQRLINSAFYIDLPTVPPDFFGGLSVGNVSEMSDALSEIKSKFNIHAEEFDIHYVTDPVTGFSGYSVTQPDVTFANYTYTFNYKYSYTVGSLSFIDRGPVLSVTVNETADIDSYAQEITLIPELVNSGEDNYDTATIEIEIHRTIKNGSTLYLVDTIANGVTEYTDDMPDATLINQTTLYTTGGGISNDPPPRCKFMHIVKNTAYYAFLEDTGEVFKNRIRHSKRGDVDSVPASFFDDIEDDFKGLSSAKGNAIAFGNESVYRMDGGFNNLGIGIFTHVEISASAGCVGQGSVVQAQDRVFWAGEDGFYVTDSFEVSKISEGLDDFYKDIVKSPNQRRRMRAAYSPLDRQIWWSYQSTETGQSVDNSIVLHLDHGVRADSTFSIMNNGDSWKPTALTFFEQEMIRGDHRGYVFRHNPSLKSDFKVDTSLAVASWTKLGVPFDWKITPINFGTTQRRKWFTKLGIMARDLSNLSIDIITTRDDNDDVTMKPIRHRANPIWDDPDAVWGTSSSWFSTINFKQGLIDEWRRFPSKIRANLRQIRFKQPTDMAIENSDEKDTADIVNSTMLVTLTDTTNKWHEYPEDFVLATDVDSYVQEYTVLSRSSDTVIKVRGKFTITAGTNDKIDYAETLAGPEKTLTLDAGIYEPAELAFHITKLFDDVEVLASQEITCSYDDSTEKFTFVTTQSADFDLLTNSGSNVATSPWTAMGFSTATDNQNATTYTGASVARGDLPADATAAEWVLRGRPKDERFNLLSLNIKWSIYSETQKDYGDVSSDTGEVQ